jgi:hypothetical protein
MVPPVIRPPPDVKTCWRCFGTWLTLVTILRNLFGTVVARLAMAFVRYVWYDDRPARMVSR